MFWRESDLDELLSQREKLNPRIQSILDQQTAAWDVKVVLVEVKQVDLAEQMIRVIARPGRSRAGTVSEEHPKTAAVLPVTAASDSDDGIFDNQDRL